jgi:DNA-binding CsgD family transcriptional regulator/PAS domain-containing protein
MASMPSGTALSGARAPSFDPAMAAATSQPREAHLHDPVFDPVTSLFRDAVDPEGTVVTWDDEHGERMILFASGGDAQDVVGDRRSESAGVCWHTVERAGCHWDTMTSSVPVERGRVTIRAFFRELGETSRNRVRESVQMMAPLFKAFFALWLKHLHASNRLLALTHALNNSGIGVVLLDSRGRPFFANDAAERLMAQQDGIRRSSGSIAATHLGDSARLHAAIEHVVASPDIVATGESIPVIALRRAGEERALMAAVMPHRVRAQAGDGEEAAAIVYLFDPGQDLRRRMEPACRHYGLSPVETRLASLLAEGATLVEAADKLRIREQTARSYLKQIFGKTDTSRQAQLVSLLLRSCVHTAPNCAFNLL